MIQDLFKLQLDFTFSKVLDLKDDSVICTICLGVQEIPPMPIPLSILPMFLTKIKTFAQSVTKLIELRILLCAAVSVTVHGMSVVDRSLLFSFRIPEIIGYVRYVLQMINPTPLPPVWDLPHYLIRIGPFGYCIFAMLVKQH
jgi:hypothetical protein